MLGLTTIDRVRCALRRRAGRSAADRRRIRLLKSELARAVAAMDGLGQALAFYTVAADLAAGDVVRLKAELHEMRRARAAALEAAWPPARISREQCP